MLNIVNITDTRAEILLHGIIGERINGHEVARELKNLKDIGIKEVKIRINSIGGSIVEGYSIVSANLDLIANGIEVETINEGVSDSMASVVLASGSRGKRKAYDFSMSVIHNPLIGGESLNDIKDEELKKIAQNFKNSLLTIYSKALGKDVSEISDLMDKETMLNADEMLQLGLIDSIIKTNISKPEIKNLSLSEIMNVYEGLNNQSLINKEKKMSKLSEFFNLSQDASEDAILSEVKNLRKASDIANAKVKELETTILDKEIQLEAFQDVVIEGAVKSAIEAGKVDEKQKSEMITLAKKLGVEDFNKMISAIKVTPVDVVKEIEDANKGEKKEVKDFEWYQKNDPQALKDMERLQPDQFKKLYDKYVEA